MIRVDSIKDIQSLSLFISQCQQHSSKHVGYIGINENEIYHSLSEDFSDLPISDSALGIYVHEELIGFLGFDIDKSERSAEVWGPLFKDDWHVDQAIDLWHALVNHIPIALDSYSFFFNLLNRDASQFAEALGATHQGNHLVLTLDRSFYLPKQRFSAICLYESTHKEAFSALHGTHFPKAYLTADEIIASLDRVHRLFIYMENGVPKGYLYAEVDSQMDESDIHFFAVDDTSQGKGIGTQLLHAATEWIFSFSSIQSITLCVSAESVAAIHLYKKAQFKETYKLSAYELHS